jgi:hypothetical protein
MSIGGLTSATALTSADQIPMQSAADADARKASLSLLLSWLQENITIQALAQEYLVPLTGFSYVVGAGNTWLVLAPAGTIAAGTVVMPYAPEDGAVVQINTTATITALTVSGVSVTLVGAPTTLAANAFFRMQYRLATNSWYRVG